MQRFVSGGPGDLVLARYGYAEVESHALKHQKLVERALELRSMAVAGELALGDVVSFVTRDSYNFV